MRDRQRHEQRRRAEEDDCTKITDIRGEAAPRAEHALGPAAGHRRDSNFVDSAGGNAGSRCERRGCAALASAATHQKAGEDERAVARAVRDSGCANRSRSRTRRSTTTSTDGRHDAMHDRAPLRASRKVDPRTAYQFMERFTEVSRRSLRRELWLCSDRGTGWPAAASGGEQPRRDTLRSLWVVSIRM